jgi:hypothetical protein
LQGIKKFKHQPVVFFAKTDEPHILNKAIMYCQNNEPTGNIKIIHLYQSLEDIPKHFEANHSILDEIYPKIQIDLVSFTLAFEQHATLILTAASGTAVHTRNVQSYHG